MITSYIIGIGGIVGLIVLWVGIQHAWRKVFKDEVTDQDDVLGIRGNCSGCGCSGTCNNENISVPEKH